MNDMMNEEQQTMKQTEPDETLRSGKKVEIIFTEDDFLDLYPQTVVNIVSCTGIKRNSTNHRLAKAFPRYSQEYKRLCLRNGLRVAEPHVHDLGTLLGTQTVVSLPIKAHWKESLQPALVKRSIENLVQKIAELKTVSLAFPLFNGPPPDWIEKRFQEAFKKTPNLSLATLYLFKEV